jgi:putative chitinase
MITLEQFQDTIGSNPYTEQWLEALNKLLPDYDINTPQRIAAFMAECAHESGNFTAIQENLNYRAESLRKVWPTHFETDAIAAQYAHKQEAIANRAYAGRMGNGNEASGDGWKFCGRGLIQLTGRENYQFFADSVGMSIDDVPAYMATFEGAVQSACYFWESNDLNKLADAGAIDHISRIINGGNLGLKERHENYVKFLKVFGG